MKDRIFTIKDRALKLAEQAKTEVLFRKVRRKTDLAYLTLYGQRKRVLAVASVFEDLFLDEDLEIIHANDGSERYALTLAITEKLGNQNSVFNEKRRKLLAKTTALQSQKSTQS